MMQFLAFFAQWREMVAYFGLTLVAFPCSNTNGSTVWVPVAVPEKFRHRPFDQPRQLRVPAGFSISVLARVPGARFIWSLTPSDTLVALPGAGRLVLVRETSPGNAEVYGFAGGLRRPQGLALTTIGNQTFLYVGESNRVIRYHYSPGQNSVSSPETVVADLPDGSSPELHGAYGHDLKDIVIGPDQELYVDIGSATNADPRDTESDPVRCAIYRYDLDGSHRQLVARGIRNAEGLGFVPGTNELWAAVNGRDELRYPFHRSFSGQGDDDYGRRIRAYIDDHPPDSFIRVRQGANYGWPFAEPSPDGPTGLNRMPFDPDIDNNPGYSRYPENLFTRHDKGIPAHFAPLGMTFLQNTKLPLPYRNGVAIACHGSWDRSRKAGYSVIFFPWQSDGEPGPQSDLVAGWLDDRTQSVWGRPVDVRPAVDGKSLLISDDYSGTIYRLSAK